MKKNDLIISKESRIEESTISNVNNFTFPHT